MKNTCLEVCVDSLDSALIAAEAGADRLELCSCLMVGGLSPDPALVELIKEKRNIPIRCLIRPRYGDFLYSENEVNHMEREIISLRAAGADGFVIGCLNSEGTLNKRSMERLIKAADGRGLTLHRCIDVSSDGLKTAREAAQLGIDTVLTSGQESSAWKGRKFIGKLIEENLPLTIMPGSGINADTIFKLRNIMPLNTFHMSGKKVLESKMVFKRQGVPMGIPGINEFTIWQTDAGAVKAALEALRNENVK